jgi:hypothetical protein
MTPQIPRSLERYPLGVKLDRAGAERWNATDRDRGRDVTVTRVAFGPERRADRDAYVERMRALYTVNSPALIAVFDAGAWDDDAFVVEERVIEPQPLGAMELDARENALAARSIAEGVATLEDAGFSLSALDVVIDAYRQPKIAVASDAEPATEASRARDHDQLAAVVESLLPGTPAASSVKALAAAIVAPAAGPGTPLVRASPPKRTPLFWAVLGLAALGAVLFLVTRL